MLIYLNMNSFVNIQLCLFPTKEENKTRDHKYLIHILCHSNFLRQKNSRYGLGVFNYDKLNCPSSIVFIIVIEFIFSKTIKEA